MFRRHSLIFLLFTCVCLCPVLAFAQQETATVTGLVRDESGAIVPKAVVIVTNVHTNISVKTETDEAGAYVIPSLRPGEYSVTVESSGFRKFVRTGITLQVAQVARDLEGHDLPPAVLQQLVAARKAFEDGGSDRPPFGGPG